MKSKFLRIFTVTSIAVLASTAMMQLASAKAEKFSGSRTTALYVDCLGDFITIDYDYNNVLVAHKDGHTLNSRQKGVAEDSNGNEWNFSGHFKRMRKHSDNPTSVHIIDRNILVSQNHDMPNLHITTTYNFVIANGDVAVDMYVESASCVAH